MAVVVSSLLALRPGQRRLRAILADFWKTAAAPAALPTTESLPPPVARYLQRALLGAAGPAPMAIGLRHRAELNRSLAKDAWWPLRSRQWMAARVPGFIWSASVRGAPGFSIDVVDAFVDGRGELGAWLWGVLPLGSARGSEAIARGELMRWLAEAVHVPWALADCLGLRWRPVDADHADAKLTAAGVSVTLRCSFGDDGLVRSVRAEDRPRMVGRAFVDTPWIGHVSDWRRCGEVLVPMRSDVAWIVDGRACPYWRGTLATWEQVAAPVHAPSA